MRKKMALLLTLTLMFTGTAIVSAGSSSESLSNIILAGDSISFEGAGATVDDNIITITSAGTFYIYGTLNDGQIVVDTSDQETVKLILNGADIHCSSSAPILVLNAEKTVISLAEGTVNTVTDGSSYILPDTESDEPNAAIFSKDDLTINGDGSLFVYANYNDGITSKDDLKITGGSITVNAVNDGIRGKDSVVIKGGITTVNAVGDGIQSNNDENSDKGYISIEDGTINIISGADGIQAANQLTVNGGNIMITAGGGSGNGNVQNSWGNRGMGTNNADSDAESAKGLKSGNAITISGGTIKIDSSDDAIHSNGCIEINSGNIFLASGDDAIHADSSLDLNGGKITITRSYEGLESSVITINEGDIHIVANDDGVNAVSDGTGIAMADDPRMNNFGSSGNNYLYINGGYLVVDAGGDGLDINGPITMTGGTVIINGPTNNGNGPLDYTGTFKISGGYLIAAGSSGMALAPSTSSIQHSVMITYPSSQAAGTMVHIESDQGEDILTFVPSKTYQSVVFSSPMLIEGSEYAVYSGGSSTGEANDGLYTGGKYQPGSEITVFSISGIVTNVGSSTDRMPRQNTTGPDDMNANVSRPNPGAMEGFLPGGRTESTPDRMRSFSSGDMEDNRVIAASYSLPGRSNGALQSGMNSVFYGSMQCKVRNIMYKGIKN